MENKVIIESRDFAQVVFENVAEWYFESKPIECKFTLSQLFKVEPTDFIGIYRVRLDHPYLLNIDSFYYVLGWIHMS